MIIRRLKRFSELQPPFSRSTDGLRSSQVIFMNHFWVFTFACAIFIIVHSAPNWGPLPNEYFQEFYDHYSENMQNHVEYLKHVHEAHHENQHRVHEKFQENFYDVNERQQEGSESDQEAYERSQEDLRSAGSDKRSTLHGRGN